MKETSQTISSGANSKARYRAGVDALEHRDAIVRAEPGMKLPVPDIECDHACSTVLEQAVRETSRRRSHVKAVLADRIDGEHLECVGEFLPTSGDETWRAVDGEQDGLVELGPGLVVTRDEAGDHERLGLSPRLG